VRNIFANGSHGKQRLADSSLVATETEFSLYPPVQCGAERVKVVGTTTRLIGRVVRRRRLRRHLLRRLRNAGSVADDLSIGDAKTGPAHQLTLQKAGRSINVGISFKSVLDNAELAAVFRQRAAAIIDPFARCRALSALGNVSDGEESRGGVIAFSSNSLDAILIPDAFFYQTQGYASYRAASQSWQTGWAARDDTIVWRGTTTGRGRISSAGMTSDDTSLLQRTRMCLILREAQGADAAFTGVAQSVEPERNRRDLQQAGILAGYVDQMTWLVRKFALDIDGNTNAWSNLFTRLLAGCCVIKIASPFGFRQWYYDELKPWQHFVPVRADLSDLLEKIDWCRMHDAECAQIAAAGRDFVFQRDFATEMKRAVETLDRRLGAD
jgi:hypothetical protein